MHHQSEFHVELYVTASMIRSGGVGSLVGLIGREMMLMMVPIGPFYII